MAYGHAATLHCRLCYRGSDEGIARCEHPSVSHKPLFASKRRSPYAALDTVTLRSFRSGVHARGIRMSPTFVLDKLASIGIGADYASISLDFAGRIQAGSYEERCERQNDPCRAMFPS